LLVSTAMYQHANFSNVYERKKFVNKNTCCCFRNNSLLRSVCPYGVGLNTFRVRTYEETRLQCVLLAAASISMLCILTACCVEAAKTSSHRYLKRWKFNLMNVLSLGRSWLVHHISAFVLTHIYNSECSIHWYISKSYYPFPRFLLKHYIPTRLFTIFYE